MTMPEHAQIEGRARELRCLGDFSFEACAGLLQELRDRDSRTSAPSTSTLAATSEAWDKYIVLYAHGNKSGLTRATEKQPELVKYINMFLQDKLPRDFGWTTVVVSYDNQFPVHKDNHNVGLNAVIGLGDYEGGQLWTAVEDPEQGSVWRETAEGKQLPGVPQDTRHRVVVFDPRKYHASSPKSNDVGYCECSISVYYR